MTEILGCGVSEIEAVNSGELAGKYVQTGETERKCTHRRNYGKKYWSVIHKIPLKLVL